MHSSPQPPTDNQRIAGIFEAIADLLEVQGASPHRVRAWRAGADSFHREPVPAGEIYGRMGRAGLEALPHIGHALASVAIEILQSGRSRLLERLRGETSAIELFSELPGIGEELAERIHRELGVTTLEDLEQAAHDGRLERLPGFGPKRLRAVRDVLAAQLGRRGRRADQARLPAPREAPPVATLLAVDELYRRRAETGELHRIAPRRFNRSGEAWLPILHEERDGWAFTAMFSNTLLAHQLGRTHDWVVVYYERGGVEGRATVVTETRGALAHRRVVRGREAECRLVHEAADAAASAALVH